MSFSESKLFEADSIIYRNQYINERTLRCAYYLSQIKQHSELSYNQKFIFLDLGGGYGLLTRYLLSYFYNSKGILIELPETCILASYYLKKNFPKKKIKILSDLNKNFTINQKSFEDTDIFILPTWSISKVSDNLVDLVINTASLGEMSKKYGEYYLKNINRIAKRYFYSHNRKSAENSIWKEIKNPGKTEEGGYGHYHYKFKGLWNVNLYNSSPGWHLEFLGEKIKDL
jgi:putative sugar O-methyltransferase